ncbi:MULTISPECIES: hypothetical protein [unclassified Cupriavidus]|uniref:hypothetical protein n=1 Tax=unclassified Cupriavidus TaxID=2640874 RepID=UPI001C004690|nr:MULTISPECIES: hypothetical protein [unclassified Cupriavidus]MCA3186913.1 hypothetical protein [Cupriavidus sp.]MCA3192983.1 hypothetical protein [Cupriavidus sp.]MCA3195835.1 hypothetical protein [Cupriavidus sp.]MCA3204736.1 hypothetical protein [Cupriavidus sp.]MCA3206868.1 hypothetical protein [Cupriavidus sp.]
MKEGISTRVGAEESHQWAGGKLQLACRLSVMGVTSYRTYVLDTRALGLKRGGWLQQAIESNPVPLSTCTGRIVVHMVQAIATDSLVKKALNCPINELTEADVIRVFSAIQTQAETNKIPTATQYVQQTSCFLKRPGLAICDGTLLDDVAYKAQKKPRTRRATDTLSDHYLPQSPNEELCIAFLGFLR